MRKFLILNASLLLLAGTLVAQKSIKKSFASASGKREINFVMDKCKVDITGYNGSEVVIETNDSYAGPPERAKGLKPLYNSATDNTGIGLEIQESGGVMTIHKAVPTTISYKIKVPADAAVHVVEDGWENSGIVIREVSGSIEIEGHVSDIKLEKVTGPVVASSVSGDIEVSFSRLNQEKPSNISATSGLIDVALPPDTKASLELTSISGEVFTDFDVKFPEDEKAKGLKPVRRKKSNGSINGGGVELSLNAISGNVYLRKQ